MKILIDITDEQYKKVKRLCDFGLNGEAEEAILYGMNFTQNATNGDIIKEMFPNARIEKGQHTTYVEFPNGNTCGFSINWWEAPYTVRYDVGREW